MNITLPRRVLLNNHSFLRTFSSSPLSKLEDQNDTRFVSLLSDIVRGNQSWKLAFNDPSISSTLRPHHVEQLLIRTLDDSKLALRFFNFLGLHKSFNHSTTSFAILVHALVHQKLFWPANHTLLLRGSEPKFVFSCFLDSHRKCKFLSNLGFDLLVQSYLQNRRVLDAVVVAKLMLENKLLPEVRTLSALLNGLLRIRRFIMVLELFDESVNVGVRPDSYTCSAVIRSLCDLKDFSKAKEKVWWMEVNKFDLSIVTYNVLIHGLCKGDRVSEAVEVKRSLSEKGLKADLVTYCTLVLGFCRVQQFEAGLQLFNEMIELGFVPSEAVVSGLVDGLRKQGKVDDAYNLVVQKGEVGCRDILF
ncbi:hypothetical protein S83_041666 [Arachis hypogaea]